MQGAPEKRIKTTVVITNNQPTSVQHVPSLPMMNVLSYLRANEVGNFALTCKEYASLALDDSIWKPLTKALYGDKPIRTDEKEPWYLSFAKKLKYLDTQIKLKKQGPILFKDGKVWNRVYTPRIHMLVHDLYRTLHSYGKGNDQGPLYLIDTAVYEYNNINIENIEDIFTQDNLKQLGYFHGDDAFDNINEVDFVDAFNIEQRIHEYNHCISERKLLVEINSKPRDPSHLHDLKYPDFPLEPQNTPRKERMWCKYDEYLKAPKDIREKLLEKYGHLWKSLEYPDDTPYDPKENDEEEDNDDSIEPSLDDTDEVSKINFSPPAKGFFEWKEYNSIRSKGFDSFPLRTLRKLIPLESYTVHDILRKNKKEENEEEYNHLISKIEDQFKELVDAAIAEVDPFKNEDIGDHYLQAFLSNSVEWKFADPHPQYFFDAETDNRPDKAFSNYCQGYTPFAWIGPTRAVIFHLWIGFF